MLTSQTVSAERDLAVAAQIGDVRRQVAAARGRGETVGVVPTMGALHAGHLSLVRTAREQCGYVVTTIFVNPTQFGPHEDFQKYPRPLESDLAACREAGVDLVFHPASAETIYPPGFSTFVEVEGLADVLEGTCRPGHFRGVTTVVLKLLNIVQPDVAYFGLKDYQQQLLIRRMCRDLDLPVDIRALPTVRDADGLALSSRNRYLSGEERERSLRLFRSLNRARERLLAGESDVAAVRREMLDILTSTPGVQVDYATVADPETLEELTVAQSDMVALVAARVGGTRLIDNLPIHLDSPKATL